jgi:hypothetical protein
VLQIGQTEVEEDRMWEEWQEGVFRAERPAERAMCRRGTGGRLRSVLWVCMKRLERFCQRVGL